MNFDELGLAEPILRAVHEAGYTTPTPIQLQAIPAVLQGGDLLAGAQTGTGKTAGFTLPMLHRLHAAGPRKDARGRVPVRALILTPTRELAAQVEESVRTYGRHLSLSSMVMFGGVGMQPQVDRLRKGVDILVATPGRLLDHHQQKTLDLSQVEIFDRTANVTGLVMTKLDGTARGGVLVPVAQASQAPVKLVGVGEGIDDLQPFDAQAFARGLVGLPQA